MSAIYEEAFLCLVSTAQITYAIMMTTPALQSFPVQEITTIAVVAAAIAATVAAAMWQEHPATVAAEKTIM